MGARFIVYFAIALIFIVSVGNAVLLLHLKIYGTNFCAEIDRWSVFLTLFVIYDILAVFQIIGLFGTLSDSTPLKCIYSIFWCVFLVGCTIVASLMFLQWNQIKPILSRCSDFNFNLGYFWDDALINRIQEKNHCCGLMSKHDWGLNSAYPLSCYSVELFNIHRPYEKPCAPFLIGIGHWLEIIFFGSLFFVSILSPIAFIGMLFSRSERTYYEEVHDL
ncbi:hypothetical protein RF11_10596 [Thelohanellus kitauei]|uniref:Tetraspanin n=1 Tax=Thelohanellus kitauei TaxID=669202 RepID=A0A0C2JG49_THEKT|nr:hypothetical protein RF11_10596 [Thelohanellus kitauei]